MLKDLQASSLAGPAGESPDARSRNAERTIRLLAPRAASARRGSPGANTPSRPTACGWPAASRTVTICGTSVTAT